MIGGDKTAIPVTLCSTMPSEMNSAPEVPHIGDLLSEISQGLSTISDQTRSLMRQLVGGELPVRDTKDVPSACLMDLLRLYRGRVADIEDSLTAILRQL